MMRCDACDFETNVVYDAAAHFYALGQPHRTTDVVAHKPDPKRVGSHCRVDCSCGWQGPRVPLFGQGTEPWTEHFKAVQ